MGRKKTYVGSVTQRLLEDEDFRTSSMYGINRYMQEQKSILHPTLKGFTVADALVDAINASMPSKMKKAHQWASREGNYVFGVPDSRVATDAEGDIQTTLMNHLRGVEAASVTLIDKIQNTQNLYHAGWMKLINMLGYSGLNNELKVLSLTKGYECYLFDGLLQLTERTEEDLILDSNIEQFGLAMTYGECFDRYEDIGRQQQNYVIGLEDQLTITYAYSVPNSKPNIPMVNTFNSTGITGYADIGSTVRFTDDLGAVLEVTADSTGLFEFEAPSESTVSGTFISISTQGESSPISHDYPYENSTPFTEPLPTEVVVYEDQVISLADINPELVEGNVIPNDYEYIQAVYEVNGEYKWFNYAQLSGEIPSLDGAVNYVSDTGKYFPRFYLRQHAKDLVDLPKTDQGRRDTEKLFKKIDLKLGEITKTINKGIGDVTDEIKFSFLNMAISVNKDMDDNITGEYVFEYFNRLHNKGEILPEEDEEEGNGGSKIGNIFEDRYTEGEGRKGLKQQIADNVYTQQIEYDKSYKKINTGVATKSSGVPFEVGEYGVVSFDRGFFRSNIHILTYQATENTYVTLTIFELTVRQLFYGQAVVVDGTDENLAIPLDYNVAYSLRKAKKEELMNKALQLTVTTLKVVKKKWYETGIFKFVMVVVSIAMNIIVPGSGMTVQALLQAVAVTVVTGIIVNVAIGILVKIAIALGFSPEALLGLVAVLVVATAFVTAGTTLNQTLLTAKNMMFVFNTSFDMYGKHIQENIKAIRKDMETFNKYATDQWEKLKETQKLLDTGVVPVDLELLTRPIETNQIYFGESEEDFYTRTTTVDMAPITSDVMGYFMEVVSAIPVGRQYEPKRSMDVDDVLLIN